MFRSHPRVSQNKPGIEPDDTLYEGRAGEMIRRTLLHEYDMEDGV